jgi:hypothetical protein
MKFQFKTFSLINHYQDNEIIFCFKIVFNLCLFKNYLQECTVLMQKHFYFII